MQWELVGTSTLNLSDRAPYDVVSVDGIGLGPVRRLTERGPFQVGVRDVGYRFDERLINLVLIAYAGSLADADDARDDLFALLRPSDTALILRATRDDGAIRQIDVHANGVIDAPINEDDRISVLQRIGMQLMAPFPYWYDPDWEYWLVLGATDPEQSSSVEGTVSGYSVPTEVPTITVESSGIDYLFPVGYTGSADTYPVATVYGPASGIVIENETAGTILSLPNLALSAGEYVEIDLAYNAKTVIDDTGANQIAELSSTSDIVTWRLVPGTNNIRFTIGSGATAATGLKLTYRIQYVSL